MSLPPSSPLDPRPSTLAPRPSSPLDPPPSTLLPRPSLIPDALKRPFMLLWLWVIPQAALVLLNLRAWSLASGEADVQQASVAGLLGAAGAGLLASGLAAWVILRALKRPVSLPLCLTGLLLNIGYLWLFIARFDNAWPRTVADWMLPQTEIIFYQFALVMPALFYCGLRLACVELPLRRGVDIGLSFGMFVAIPLAWYILFHIVERLPSRLFRGSIETVAIVLFAASTVFVMMAFLRLLYYLYTWLAEQPWGQTAMTAVAGLLCPVGGLLLNIKIPFPCDFQSVGVYVLAIVNGLLLIVPLPRHAGRAALTAWARSALYPFTLYFFIVFLPFLPCSLAAMLVCGAGFLILAPTLLFIIHTRRLAADRAALTARFGRGPAIALLLLGLLALPTGFAARAWLDRQALTGAMDTVFSPDVRQARTTIHPYAVARAINGLRDMKDGIYLPFLSDAYNQLVFQGMVLTDDKMETLSRTLLGKPAPRAQKSERFSFFFAPRSMSRGSAANRATPPRDVTLRPPQPPESVVSNRVRRSTVKLELTNNGPANSEFVGKCSVPDGILVSGFWLDVAGKRKPGTIVEKKTALWVYHMIRDFTRRDPGLLVCDNSGALTLNVFPFAAGETRTVWIEFMGPAALRPRLTFNDVPILLTPDQPADDDTPCLVPGADACVVPATALSRMPRVTRSPVVHFILDHSAAATNPVAIPPALCETVTQLGGRCRVTFANVESIDAEPASESPDAAANRALLPVDLPARAGFAPDRAIARHLLNASTGDATVPIFVVIPAAGSTPVRTLDLAPFARLTPEIAGYYLWSSGHLAQVSFADGRVHSVDAPAPPTPVVLFRAGGRTTAVPPDADSALVDLHGWDAPAAEPAGRPTSTLEVYNPDSGAFEPLAQWPVLDDAPYAAGLRLQLDSRAARLDPSSLDRRLPTLVDRSHATGILCPFTSYMVVENTAQEQTLAIRQKQALSAHHALEFEEKSASVPEPGVPWLLPLALLILWWAERTHGPGRGPMPGHGRRRTSARV